jgi:hypothetical protein
VAAVMEIRLEMKELMVGQAMLQVQVYQRIVLRKGSEKGIKGMEMIQVRLEMTLTELGD